MKKPSSSISLLALCTAIAACSGSNAGPDALTDSGGSPSQQTSQGGATGSKGGSNATAGGNSNPATAGGTVASSGGAAAGGAAAGGVSTSSGGTAQGGNSAGGSNTKGGATATGGDTAQGGSTAKGGATATGGVSAVGGAISAGGVAATGGKAATGGTATGGLSTGGTATGGKAATGGTATGGQSTGGSATGGVTATGGSSTGGTTASNGCPLTMEGFATVNADGQNGTNGGGDGKTVTVTNQADLDRYATATEPYTIRVQGKITISPKGTEIRVNSDKTIIGVGATGEISEGGFFLNTGVHNVIIRNLTIGNTRIPSDTDGKEFDYDGIQMDTAHHVWIDHCTFHDINDGMIDSRKDTTYVTTSWNVLHDHNKTYGIGWTDNLTAQMTIHHNILRDTNQRNPSTDNVLRAHLFNNWMLRLESYGNYARQGTNMVLENSVFDQVKDPHYYDTGTLVAIGNIYRSTTGQKESSGSTYSFFDPSKFYKYTLNPASEVEALLTKCAGPRAELGN